MALLRAAAMMCATTWFLLPRSATALVRPAVRRHMQRSARRVRPPRPLTSPAIAASATHNYDDDDDDANADYQRLADIYHIDVREPHPRTVEVATRHCTTFPRYAERTIHAQHTVEAFNEACAFVDQFYASQGPDAVRLVVLDSGCGAGLSTYSLASLYPHMPVIGVDRSIARLSRNKRITVKAGGSTARDADSADDADDGDDEEEDEADAEGAHDRAPARHFEKLPNAILLRAELSDFYMLASKSSDWVVHSHYMLYPNPYPKAKHLQRRWHGHPAFPVILALGGKLVLRSNWDVYCAEMVAAVEAVVAGALLPGLTSCDTRQCTAPGTTTTGDTHSAGIDAVRTHFQNKYLNAGVPVFEASFDLGQRTLADRRRMLDGIVDRKTADGTEVRADT